MVSRMQLVEGQDPTDSVGRRLVAAGFDQILVGFVTVVAFALSDVRLVRRTDVVPGGSAASYVYEGPAWQLLVVGSMWLVYWVGVFVVWQGLTGHTPGKLLLSLRCVRWDGRPPGLAKAALRTFPYLVGTAMFGVLWWGISVVVMLFTRGHRRVGDLLAQTFVVGATYEGRIISLTSNRAAAGPPSVYASDLDVAPSGVRSPATPIVTRRRPRPHQPEYDKQLDTYIVWDERSGTLLALDKPTGEWRPLP